MVFMAFISKVLRDTVGPTKKAHRHGCDPLLMQMDLLCVGLMQVGPG